MVTKDKLMHLGVSCIASLAASVLMFLAKCGALTACLCGVWFTVGLGMGKEYGDSKSPGNKWDWVDFVFDIIGIALGQLILFLAWLWVR